MHFDEKMKDIYRWKKKYMNMIQWTWRKSETWSSSQCEGLITDKAILIFLLPLINGGKDMDIIYIIFLLMRQKT